MKVGARKGANRLTATQAAHPSRSPILSFRGSTQTAALTPGTLVRSWIVVHEQDLAIVKGLVSVAWADGRMSGEEREVLEGLLQAYKASPSEVVELRKYAETPRTIDDIPINELSYDDRRVLLLHAVLIAYIDGERTEREGALLDVLCEKLRIPDLEAKGLVEAAIRRVKQMR